MAPLVGSITTGGTMNNADYMRVLFDASYWARDRILTAAEGMTEEEYAKDYGFTYKSLRGILTHALFAENLYFLRLTGTPEPTTDSPEWISEANLPTIEAFKARALDVEKLARSYLQTLTDEVLESELSFTRRDGIQVTQPRWQTLTQVVQHSISHRSEAAEVLTMAGRSPGDLDFVVYMNSRS